MPSHSSHSTKRRWSLRSAKKNSYATLKNSVETRETCSMLKIIGRPVIKFAYLFGYRIDLPMALAEKIVAEFYFGRLLETVLPVCWQSFGWMQGWFQSCIFFGGAVDESIPFQTASRRHWRYIPKDMSMALHKALQPKDLNQASSFWCRDSHQFTSGRVKASAGKAPDARLRILRRWSDSHNCTQKMMIMHFFFTFRFLEMTWIASPRKTQYQKVSLLWSILW